MRHGASRGAHDNRPVDSSLPPGSAAGMRGVFAETQYLRDLSSVPEAISGRELMPGVLAHVGAGSRRPL